MIGDRLRTGSKVWCQNLGGISYVDLKPLTIYIVQSCSDNYLTLKVDSRPQGGERMTYRKDMFSRFAEKSYYVSLPEDQLYGTDIVVARQMIDYDIPLTGNPHRLPASQITSTVFKMADNNNATVWVTE